MSKVKGDYWVTEENTVKLQLRTNQEQRKLQEILPDWICISYGYVPRTNEDIYIFEKHFNSELDWTKFLKSDKVNQLIEMKEVLND